MTIDADKAATRPKTWLETYDTIEELAQSRGQYSAQEIRVILYELCTRLASGETLTSCCRDEMFPHINTIMNWQAWCEEIRRVIVRAREVGAEALVDLSIDVTHTTLDPARAGVQSRALQWAATRFNQRRFGDKQTVEHTGTVNLRAAIAAGQKRAEARILRHICDLDDVSDAQVIDESTKRLHGPTD